MATVTVTELPQPRREDLRLESVFHALSDPVRLHVVRELAGCEDPVACGSIELPVTKSTRSHHFRVLREAGVITTRHEGRSRVSTLRRDDLEARFPGLIATVLAAGGAAEQA